MKNTKKHLLTVLTLISLILVNCKSNKNIEDKTTPFEELQIITLSNAQYLQAQIKTDTLTPQHLSSEIKVNGFIDVPPQSLVSISTPLGGYVTDTKLLPGMFIKKGEILAIMEDIQYIQLQQDYLTSKAQLTMIEQEYKRQQELNISKSSSDKMYEQSLASYQSQYILIKSLEEKLKLIGINPKKITADNISKKIHIYSPITGFVSNVHVNIGKHVSASEVLFEIVNPNDIHLNLTVFEKDIHELKVGQNIWAYTNTNPTKKYLCNILLIGRKISNQRAIEVHCHFKNYDPSLLPGMYMNADIETTKQNTLAVPNESIVRHNNAHYIFTDEGNKKFKIHPVNIGISKNGYTEILNHKTFIDKKIVTSGSYTLLMVLKNGSNE